MGQSRKSHASPDRAGGSRRGSLDGRRACDDFFQKPMATTIGPDGTIHVFREDGTVDIGAVSED